MAHINGQTAGVTVTSYSFMVKDSNGKAVDNAAVNTNAQSAIYNFNQSTPGTYTVSVMANGDKGTSAACTQQITVSAPASTLSASTTKASALPNTGPGDVLGIFSGASLAGAAGHYAYRRLRR